MKKIFFLILLLAAFGPKPVQAQTANPSHVGVCLTDSCTGSSAPSYAFVTSTYVAETGAGPFASITSPSITLSAGQLAVMFCRNPTLTTNAFTFSSTPSNTWNSITAQLESTATGNSQIGYAFNVGAGSTTFTCTPASSAGFMSMIVVVYSASPYFSTLNTSSTLAATSTSTSATSSTFSTTHSGVILMCTTISTASATWTAGTIAGQTATIRQTSDATNTSGDAVCEDYISGTSQTSVTGSVSWTSTRNWNLTVGAFN
jgi:hypothetical protein